MLLFFRAFATARALELCERPDPNGTNMKSPPQKLRFGWDISRWQAILAVKAFLDEWNPWRSQRGLHHLEEVRTSRELGWVANKSNSKIHIIYTCNIVIYYIDLIQYLIMIIQICYYCRRSGTVALVVINSLCIQPFLQTSSARCDCQVPSLQVLVTAPNLRRGAFYILVSFKWAAHVTLAIGLGGMCWCLRHFWCVFGSWDGQKTDQTSRYR